MLVYPLTGAWAQQASPRGADHGSFGRMVFDWGKSVQWSADVVNGQLVVRFDEPMVGDPKVLLRPLGRYLKSATLSADRRMATFPLVGNLEAKTFVVGTSTVVDLTPMASEATTVPKPTEGGASPPVESGEVVTVRGGAHTGFNRLMFDWPKAVGYSVTSADNRVTIQFNRPAMVNRISLETALPADVQVQEVRSDGKPLTLVLGVPADVRVRHFATGTRIGIDLVRAAGSAPPTREGAPGQPPLAPPPGTETQPPAATPLAPSVPVVPEPPPPPPVATPTPPPPPPPPPPVAGPHLAVGFNQPSGAALFTRAGWVWLVFNNKTLVNPENLKRSASEAVTFIEEIPSLKSGTALRMVVKPGLVPSIRLEGSAWRVDFGPRSTTLKRNIAIQRQFDFLERGRLILPLTEVAPRSPVQLRDPETGEAMQVMAVLSPGLGVRSEIQIPGAELPATIQGVVLIPLADGVRLEGKRNALEVAMPGGLFLSKIDSEALQEEEPPLEESRPQSMGPPTGDAVVSSAPPVTSAPLDVPRWWRGGQLHLYPERIRLMHRLVETPVAERTPVRLDLARLYLANGMAAEALGVLANIAVSDPPATQRASFLAVRGAANFLMARNAEAIADLGSPAAAADPQVQLWLAAAMARASDPAKQALTLRLFPEELKGMSSPLRMALGRIATESTLAAGDTEAAEKIVEAMVGPGLPKRDVATISYIRGRIAEAGQQWDEALTRYQESEDNDSRPDRAHASSSRIEMLLRRNQISPQEAVDQLEKLRFAWRDSTFEYALLKRIAELHFSIGRYGEGLRTLRYLTSNYEKNPDIASVQKMMDDAFEQLYLQDGADKLTPVTAIALYEEFKDLTPTGSKGDEMIRKLADRLAKVDLLDQAAELLSHQVQSRVDGVEKARIGMRLAILNLSDGQPATALQSLDNSETPDQPPDLYNQRRYLRVKALGSLGRGDEALALIINDQAETANKLRAEIYWDMKKWPEAAAALEATLEKPEGDSPIQPAAAQRLLDLATTMVLGRDERGLQRLRRTYGTQMAKTDFREPFELFTSENELGIIDYRKIGDKIKQVQDFGTFMGDWKKRVKTEGLSSVN